MPHRSPYSVCLLFAFAILLTFSGQATSQSNEAQVVIDRAVSALGGEKYLSVKSQIGRGKFSIIRDGAIISFQSFVDVIVFPDKGRTEFKGGGVKSVQSNVGQSGWLFDGDNEIIKVQTPQQVENFKRGIRSSIDNLLRGHWRNEAELTYVGRRPATLGKRNDVLRLTYKDGFEVEFEIGVETGIPAKTIQRKKNADGEEIIEEDRYAQFLDFGGISSPFIIDRFTGGVQTSRINYETVEYNKRIPDSIFAKPSNAKEAKKDPKF